MLKDIFTALKKNGAKQINFRGKADFNPDHPLLDILLTTCKLCRREKIKEVRNVYG